MAQLLERIEIDGAPAGDEALLAWLDGGAGRLVLRWNGALLDLERVARDSIAQLFGFVRLPQPE